jgi:hypothetical protein
MVAQLGSLIGVVVLFMMETMDQVSLKMELSWTFNKSFQNSKKLFLSLIGLDMLTCRVLEILLNNFTWSQYKSWSVDGVEEHTRRWHQWDLILSINFEVVNCHQCFDNAILEVNYLLIQNPNAHDPLIKVVEYTEVNNFDNWPIAQFSP